MQNSQYQVNVDLLFKLNRNIFYGQHIKILGNRK